MKKKNLRWNIPKAFDSSLAKNYGWRPNTNFETGLSNTINDYLQKQLTKK